MQVSLNKTHLALTTTVTKGLCVVLMQIRGCYQTIAAGLFDKQISACGDEELTGPWQLIGAKATYSFAPPCCSISAALDSDQGEL